MKQSWFGRGARLGSCALLCMLSATWAAPARPAGEVVFTPEERAWIAAHPVVRVAADPACKPVVYEMGGHYHGLAIEYLRLISRETGLRFAFAAPDAWRRSADLLRRDEIDLLPAEYQYMVRPELAAQLTFVGTYFVSATVIVSQSNAPMMVDATDLAGKRVAMKRDGAQAYAVAKRYPSIKIIDADDTEDALEAVIAGRADAAIDSEIAVSPLLRRRYGRFLKVSGALPGMTSDLSIGVHRDLPLLQSIVRKALRGVSASEADLITREVLAREDYGAPSLSVLAAYYAEEAATLAFCVSVLVFFFVRARRDRRTAMESERQKAMFLAVMSHEIRSPLNGILASIELLNDVRLDPEQARLAQIAISAAQALQGLLDDALDISRLDAGRVDLAPVPTPLREFVREVAVLVEFKAQAKGLAFVETVDAPDDVVPYLDQRRIGQIMRNLLFNAVKFTSHGRIALRVTLIVGRQRASRGELWIRVTDSGIGIPEKERGRIFEPFVRGSNAAAGGAGLGLSICKELAALMGGTITLCEHEGPGACFDVRLPVTLVMADASPAAPSAGHAAGDHVAGARHEARVLVVEDQEVNRYVLDRQLRSLGCRVLLAADGASGIALLEREALDLVLLDYNLPDMAGDAVAVARRRFEKETGAARLPIIALSAGVSHAQQGVCFDAGIDGFVKKPVRLHQLAALLELWCEVAVLPTLPEANSGIALDVPAILTQDALALRAAFNNGQDQLVAHYAHRLKGAALTLALSEVVALAASVEADLRAGTIASSTATGLGPKIERLVDAVQRLRN